MDFCGTPPELAIQDQVAALQAQLEALKASRRAELINDRTRFIYRELKKEAREKENPEETVAAAKLETAFSVATASVKKGPFDWPIFELDRWDQYDLLKQVRYLMFREDSTRTRRLKNRFLLNLEYRRRKLGLDDSSSIEEVEMARRENHTQRQNEIATKKAAKKTTIR